MPLLEVFAASVRGQLPPPDESVEVCPSPPGTAAAVVAFPAHFYVVAPVEPGWVRDQLPPGDLGAPLGARFIVALADRIGAPVGENDAVLGTRAHGAGPELDLLPVTDETHPRAGGAWARPWPRPPSACCPRARRSSPRCHRATAIPCVRRSPPATSRSAPRCCCTDEFRPRVRLPLRRPAGMMVTVETERGAL